MVLEGLVPALDLTLGLGLVGSPAHVIHAVLLEVFVIIFPLAKRFIPALLRFQYCCHGQFHGLDLCNG